ncbi:hypothetical protein LL06_23205 [Hoeflea sp. BAL378]|uniref:hypothetical protein n=1 Tax=Hoeflea sp. BAL378 TaxID=1547437 RepID=UPI0005147BF0|nr:hypothetical protein [Hoeflea sp. BAL378]KGF67318.1 hypothetical protein LL06_23205 [Hoeflea sp. BAL378]
MTGASEIDPRRRWTLDCGARYWPDGHAAIAALPVPVADTDPGAEPALRHVALPDWADDLGVDGRLLVFACALSPADGRPEWQGCDWIATAFHMLAGSPERAHESASGPVLSYSFRLPRALDPLHQRAWVNRIFLFLRRWAAHEAGLPEEALFGPLPQAQIRLTHDVDALKLTPEIRLKQTVFQMANAARAMARGDGRLTRIRLSDARRYAFSAGDFQTFARVRAMESAAGLRSTLHFYSGLPGLRRGSPHRILIDPAYDIGSELMRGELRAFAEGGWTVGLHQSFGAWDDAGPMLPEKARLERALGGPVRHCRQHWLHFSWARTWAAQAAAGLECDSTLGFNDRPGFRGSHALTVRPWDMAAGRALAIDTVPMLFMDSHFYDYASGGRADPETAMRPWLQEVRAVGGEVTVNWHTHTITDVYGWGSGFESLLGLLS